MSILLSLGLGNGNWRGYINTRGVRLVDNIRIYKWLNNYTRDKVYIAPSGVQKERIRSEDIFVLPFPQPTPTADTARVFLRKPTRNLKESACTPLFWNAFDLRDSGSCIHTHSQNAVMATLLWTGGTFTISHQEVPSSLTVFLMLGLRALYYR